MGRHRSPAPAVAWALYAALAIAGWMSLPAGGFWINDEGVKYLQAMAINSSPAASSEIRLDFSPEETGGLLPHAPVYLWRTGQGYRFLYPDYFARLAALARRAAGETGMRLVPLVAGLGAVAFWTLAARQSVPRAALFVPLVVLGSPWMFYHWVFWEHTVALAAQTGSLLAFVWGWRRRRAAVLLAAGIGLGLCVFLRAELALYAVALALGFGLAFRDWRRPGLFLLGVGVPVAALLLLNQQQWGHPLGSHYAGVSLATTIQGSTRWQTIRILLVGMTGYPWTALAAATGALGLVFLSARRGRGWAVGGLALGLGGALLARARFLTLSDPFAALVGFASLVTLAPVFWAGLGVGFAWRARRRRALALTAVLFVLGAAVSYPGASAAGIHWGPRLLLPALVPLGLLGAERLAAAVRRARREPRRRWEAVGLAAGLALGWLDTAYSWHLLNRARTHNAAIERFLGERPERFIVTNLWWVPQVYARAAASHSFVLLQSPDDYRKFRAFAASRGERAWLLATGRQTALGAPAELLAVPGAPDRGTVLDVRLYRLP
jgi:hypothetical protein